MSNRAKKTNTATAGTSHGNEICVGSAECDSQTCGSCDLPLNENIICCDFCNDWYHFSAECAGFICKDKKIVRNDHILYRCTTCIEAKQIERSKAFAKLSEQIENIKDYLFSVDNKVESLQQDVHDAIRGKTPLDPNMKKESCASIVKAKIKNVLVIK